MTSEKTAASTSVFNVSSSPYWKVFYYSGPNGTLNIGEESDITIYPNPSSGKFSMSGFPINLKLNVQIFNSSGQLVLKQIQSSEIDLSAYPKGIYFVLINDGEKVISKKLVVE